MRIVISLEKFEVYAISLSLLVRSCIAVEDLIHYYFDYNRHIDYQHSSFVGCVVDDMVNLHGNINTDHCHYVVSGFELDFTHELEMIFNKPISAVMQTYGSVGYLDRYTLLITDENTLIDYQHIDLIRSQAKQ